MVKLIPDHLFMSVAKLNIKSLKMKHVNRKAIVWAVSLYSS